MKKNHFFELALLCLVIAVCISFLNKSENISPPPAAAVRTLPAQQPADVPPAEAVKTPREPQPAAIPPDMAQVKSQTAPPPPPQPPPLNWRQVSDELKKLREPIAQAIADQIRQREILVDSPEYCAFLVKSIDADAAAEIEEKINDIRSRAAPDSRRDTDHWCDNKIKLVDQARQYSVVEVMLDRDGFASVNISRTPVQLPVKFNQWGSFVPDVTGIPGVEVVQSSASWGPDIVKLYEGALPAKIKQTMSEARAQAMKGEQ